jgi:hypothetical protein
MTKATVTRLFIGSVVAAAAGAIFAIAAVWIAIENRVFTMSGQDIVGLQSTTLTWVLIVVGVVGVLAVVGGAITGLVAWIGALLNTSQLESKTWFLALLLLGIFNFGFLAMIAYVIAGPDGRPTVARTPVGAQVSA